MGSMGKAKINMCVSGLPTYLGFHTDPKNVIANCNLLSYAENRGKCGEKCNF